MPATGEATVVAPEVTSVGHTLLPSMPKMVVQAVHIQTVRLTAPLVVALSQSTVVDTGQVLAVALVVRSVEVG